jgi:PAS domain S-box-containing protein
VSVTVYILGTLLLTAASVLALFQVRYAPRRLPWLLIALSSLLMVIRRVTVLIQSWMDAHPLDQEELITPFSSLLLLLGVILMSRMFRDIQGQQGELKASQTALLATSRYARNLIEISLDPLVAISPEGIVSDINAATEKITGVDRDRLIGSDFSGYFTEPEVARVGYLKAFDQEQVVDYPLALRHVSGVITDILFNASVYRNDADEVLGLVAALRDVTEHKQVRFFREMGQKVLNILSGPENLNDLTRRVLSTIKEFLGADAVGIRLKEGEDFPYFVQEGFSEDFLSKENSLLNRGRDGGVCVDCDGRASLECTCGLVISGKTDPSSPLFTRRGSAWTNNSFQFLGLSESEDIRTHPRDECIHLGYASVALIPIRAGGRIVGLFQINDRRKGRFTQEMIESLESLVEKIGEALLRKRAEEKLRTNSVLLQIAGRTARFGGWSVNLADRQVIWSDEVALIHGKQPGYFPTVDEGILFYTPDGQNRFTEVFGNCASEGIPYDEELEIVNASGSRVWVRTTGEAVRDESGHITRVQGSFQDITEHKRVESELRESQAKLEAALASMVDAVFISDSTGEFIHFNDAFASFHRFKSKNECARHLSEYPDLIEVFLPDGSLAPLEKWAVPRALRGEAVSNAEYTLHRKDSGETWVGSYSFGPIRNGVGEIVGSVVIARDITDIKRSEEENANLQVQLNQAQKMESVGRLAGGVAHDFNNMLGVILGHTEIAMDWVDPSQPIFNSLQEIHQAADRSANLTRQLLTFARKQTVSPQILNLNETVSGMLKMLGRLIGEDIELLWHPETDVWPVRVDPTQVDQILANLCVNARDAIDGVGQVTIETENKVFDTGYCVEHPEILPGEYVCLVVRDSGCGMSSETLLHIFEPFFTTKGIGQGTGLGLATVYGIVKQNRGFINVHSELNLGTSFKIYLPRHTADGSEETPAEITIESLHAAHEIVLLVEDELAILKMTTKLLERLGYGVLPASSPGEAIEQACRFGGKIDLLLTDVVMPDMNGRDLARNLLRIYPDLKCLFMSGYTADVIAHHGVLDEGVHFIQKPFSASLLAAKMSEALELRET